MKLVFSAPDLPPFGMGRGPDRGQRPGKWLGESLGRWAGAAALLFGLALTPALAEPPLKVEVLTARQQPGQHVFSLSGEIVARASLNVSFPTSGRILSIFVTEGTRVAKGDELARIESVQQEQALRAATAALQAAKADRQQARDEFQRQDTLLKRGATTRIRRNEAERSLRIAAAGTEQARAEMDRATKALADTVLRAPQDATVTDRLADPGQVVGAASPVISLALGRQFDAVFQAPESLPAALPDDTLVALSLIDRPDVIFQGNVRRLAPLVDPASGTVKVTVGVTDPPPGLGYGDAVRGTVTRKLAPRTSLPYTVLAATEQGPAVWVLDSKTNTVSLRQITISQFEDGRIIVGTGLKDGDKVIGRGAYLLFPGRVVDPVEAGK